MPNSVRNASALSRSGDRSRPQAMSVAFMIGMIPSRDSVDCPLAVMVPQTCSDCQRFLRARAERRLLSQSPPSERPTMVVQTLLRATIGTLIAIALLAVPAVAHQPFPAHVVP